MTSKIDNSNKQRGAVSLITVILLMLIFIIVTLGFLRLAINEQRQSIDFDLNNRAYYAAESGVEDARRLLNQFLADDGVIDDQERVLLNGDDCGRAVAEGAPEQTSSAVLSEELDTTIVCQLVDLSPPNFATSLNADSSVFIPLIPENGDAGSVSRVLIEWHEKSDANVGFRDQRNQSLPQLGCWDSSSNSDSDACGSGESVPAMLRLGLFGHPSGGQVNRDNISNQLAYVSPSDGSGDVTKSNFGGAAVDGTRSVSSDIADCDDDDPDEFKCRLEITNLSDVNYLRITPLYRGTDLRVTMYDSDGNVLNFTDAQLLIDVTARAGDVTRRVEARVPRAGLDLYPNDALNTAYQICKLTRITQPSPGVRVGDDDCQY
jgi:hypothetical protein